MDDPLIVRARRSFRGNAVGGRRRVFSGLHRRSRRFAGRRRTRRACGHCPAPARMHRLDCFAADAHFRRGVARDRRPIDERRRPEPMFFRKTCSARCCCKRASAMTGSPALFCLSCSPRCSCLLLSPRQTKSAWLNIVVVALAAGLPAVSPGPAMRSGPKASRASSIRPPISCISSRPRRGSARFCRSRSFLPPPATTRRRSPLRGSRRCVSRLSASSALPRCSITGSINTWYLAGSIPALTETDYGRLLLLKIALFLVMVAVAAFNRLHLTPRLVRDADGATTGQRSAGCAATHALKSQSAPSSSPSSPRSAPIRRASRRSSTLTITIDASKRPL